MKKFSPIIAMFILTVSCQTKTNNKNLVEEKQDVSVTNALENDTTPKVTGVGGIFFFSDNPKETREWYAKNLGFDVNDWGATFESRNLNNPDIIKRLQWSPFKTNSQYFAPSTKEFMINYTVQHIEKLVENLKAKGVTVIDDIEDSEYGKFVHIMDADGNKIELWEPPTE